MCVYIHTCRVIRTPTGAILFLRPNCENKVQEEVMLFSFLIKEKGDPLLWLIYSRGKSQRYPQSKRFGDPTVGLDVVVSERDKRFGDPTIGLDVVVSERDKRLGGPQNWLGRGSTLVRWEMGGPVNFGPTIAQNYPFKLLLQYIIIITMALSNEFFVCYLHEGGPASQVIRVTPPPYS